MVARLPSRGLAPPTVSPSAGPAALVAALVLFVASCSGPAVSPQVEANLGSAPTDNATAGSPPVILSAEIEGDLVEGVPATLTATCRVSDPDDDVAVVRAALWMVGTRGSENLTRQPDGRWVWTGTVVPEEAGGYSVTFAAIDDEGGQANAAVWVEVAPRPANQPPVFETLWVAGDLAVGRTDSFDIVCRVYDPDGEIVAVSADLGPLGVANPAVLLLGPGGSWTWHGTVRPPAGGSLQVRVRARDGEGAETSAYAPVSIAAPPRNEKPVILDVTAEGDLVAGEPGEIRVTCYAFDPDGAIVSVTAFLDGVGGPYARVLGGVDEETWLWVGEVRPVQAGPATVRVSVADDAGGLAVADAPIEIAPAPGPP